jgi:hypothetical protein
VHLNLTCNVVSIQAGSVLDVFERAIMAFSRPTDPDHETGDQQVGLRVRCVCACLCDCLPTVFVTDCDCAWGVKAFFLLAAPHTLAGCTSSRSQPLDALQLLIQPAHKNNDLAAHLMCVSHASAG